MTMGSGSSYRLVAPYEIEVINTSGKTSFIDYQAAWVDTEYTLSINLPPSGAYLQAVDKDGIITFSKDGKLTFKPRDLDTTRIRIGQEAIGTFSFSNPMLTIGTEPKPFVPQQRSMIAFETELAAHPVDGSNPDKLFMGDDGLPYVLEPWKKVTLDENKKYEFYQKYPSYKTMFLVGGVPSDRNKDTLPYVVKYDGTMLKAGAPTTEPDAYSVVNWTNSVDGKLGISIPNTDSGWGPDYEPSREEINAFFLGWKMGVVGQPRTVLYNGEGGRVWYKISMCTVNAKYSLSRQDWVEYDVPTYPAGVDSVGTYNYPYRLQYLKAKPTVEPVRNYELGATLTAGSNMVEVGSGIVIRERANPVNHAGLYYLVNHINFPASYLQHKTKKIHVIYADNAIDSNWTHVDIDAYGKDRVYVNYPDYDPTAVYHVTYTMLDPTLAAPISGTVAANLRGTVSDLVHDVGDVQRRLSVVETRKDAVEDTGWIPVTPLNGWTHYPNKNLYFRVLGNRLYLRGMLQDGQGSVKTIMFYLPVKTHYGVWEKVATWSDNTNVKIMQVNFTPSGNMVINSGSALKFVSFDGLVFEFDRLELV
ncbi:hypothetical protein DOE73_30540 [Paenibacillus dendritiformis]|nr:hypothetical protein DOE73_30540 [Paenibacillus dendritiformis]